MTKRNHIESYRAKGRTYYKVSFTLCGIRVRRSNLSKVEAEIFYNKVRTDILSGAYVEDKASYSSQSFKTVSELIKEYVGYLRTQTSLRESSIRAESNSLYYLGEELGENKKLRDLSSKSFIKAFESLTSKNSPAYNTKKNYRIFANKLIKWGVKRGYIENLELIDTIRGRRSKSSRKEFFTREELTNFFNEFKETSISEQYYYRFYFAQFQLALRVGEIAALIPSDINWEENTIFINRTFSIKLYRSEFDCLPTKNNKSAVLPISEELKAILASQMEFRAKYHPESRFLFLGSKAQGFDYSVHNRKVKSIAKRAGIEGSVSTHIFRKSWVCFGVEANIPITYLAQYARHTPQVLLETYTEVKSHLFYKCFDGYTALNSPENSVQKGNIKATLDLRLGQIAENTNE